MIGVWVFCNENMKQLSLRVWGSINIIFVAEVAMVGLRTLVHCNS